MGIESTYPGRLGFAKAQNVRFWPILAVLGPGLDRNSPGRHFELSRPNFLFSQLKTGYRKHLPWSAEVHKMAQSVRFAPFRPFWGRFRTSAYQDDIFSFRNLVFRILRWKLGLGNTSLGRLAIISGLGGILDS